MATNDRLPPIAAEKMTAEQKKAAEEFEAGRGYAVSGPFAVMLRSPEVMLRAKAMGDYLRFRNVLPKRVSEMVILITAREWTQQFEWATTTSIALEAGLAKADHRGHRRRPPSRRHGRGRGRGLRLLDRAASSAAASATRPMRGRWQLFGEQGIIDLIGVNGYYSFIAMMMNVARTPARHRRRPAAEALPGLIDGRPTPPPTALPGWRRCCKAQQGKGPAPVEKWNPPYCGDIGMKIRADGVWIYGGTPIGRMPLVKLFAGVLRKDADGKHYLVTPPRKSTWTSRTPRSWPSRWRCRAAGASSASSSAPTSTTSSRPARSIRCASPSEPGSQGLKPYLLVRGRLEALVTRALYYDLSSWPSRRRARALGLWSGGRVLCDAAVVPMQPAP